MSCHFLLPLFVLSGLTYAVSAWGSSGERIVHRYVSPFDKRVRIRQQAKPHQTQYHYGYVSGQPPSHSSGERHPVAHYYEPQNDKYEENGEAYVHPYIKTYKKHYPILIPVAVNHVSYHKKRRPHRHGNEYDEDASYEGSPYYDSYEDKPYPRRRHRHYYHKKKTTTPTTTTTEGTTTATEPTTTPTETPSTATPTITTTPTPSTTTPDTATTTVPDTTTTTVSTTTPETTETPTTTTPITTTETPTTTPTPTTTASPTTTTTPATTTTEAMSTYPPHEHPDYYGYSHGYAPKAPKLMDNDYCHGLADGNFANPGMSSDADPRCTYVTCAGQRPVIFNCPYGTFNGYGYRFHTPVYNRTMESMIHIPHHRYGAQGSDFCGYLDVPTHQGPLCARADAKNNPYHPKYKRTTQPPTTDTTTTRFTIFHKYPGTTSTQAQPTTTWRPSTYRPPSTYGPIHSPRPHYGQEQSEYRQYRNSYINGPHAMSNDFCEGMQDGHYADPGIMQQFDPRCTYISCSYGRAFMFACPPGTFNGVNYRHHKPVWGQNLSTYRNVHHYRYPNGGFCNRNDFKSVCRK